MVIVIQLPVNYIEPDKLLDLHNRICPHQYNRLDFPTTCKQLLYHRPHCKPVMLYESEINNGNFATRKATYKLDICNIFLKL